MKQQERALLFAPYSIIWPHIKAESALILKLQKSGYAISTIRCDGLFGDSCSMHKSFRHQTNSIQNSKVDICNRCILMQKSVDHVLDSSVFQLVDLLSKDDLETAERYVKDTPNNKIRDFELEGIPIGRLTFYEFLINNKLTDEVIPIALQEDLNSGFKNCLLVAFAALNFLKREKVDVIFTYNRLRPFP